ncbi:uncharacterized protein LOC114579714 isoform X2 [Dendrobium catenatum]|uniref:uncharacterized protein LOC114579714 isoform X2 n=1 Tax=Dendrobium catenatum TaxID=906689 RepID=UPI00109F2BA3|nr:uncharacterized protein LOC114579714 isoform X2 [Dendrobium catenatum]
MVKGCFKFKITQNAPISLTWDHWYNCGTLRGYLGGDIFDNMPDFVLKDLISQNSWVFPEGFPHILRGVIENISGIGGDGPCLFWKNSNVHKYKHFLEEYFSEMPSCLWHKMVWHKRHILKHSVFVWLALHRGLKTAEALLLRNIQVPRTCSLCYDNDEYVSHLYFECPYSFNILHALIPRMHSFFPRPNILQVFDWLKVAFKGNAVVFNFYNLVVRCVIYYIWKERNNRRFGNKALCFTSLLLCIKRAIYEKHAMSGQ